MQETISSEKKRQLNQHEQLGHKEYTERIVIVNARINKELKQL